MSRAFLIVVDMQHDFVDGSLGTPEAALLVAPLSAYVDAFEGELAVTLDTHTDAYLTTQEGKRLPVAHCIRNTPGWELVEPLRSICEARQARVFEKPTFGSLELASWLAEEHKRQSITSLELCGVCTDICVVSNALLIKAALPEVPLMVQPALCAGTSPKAHEAALTTLASCQVELVSR